MFTTFMDVFFSDVAHGFVTTGNVLCVLVNGEA